MTLRTSPGGRSLLVVSVANRHGPIRLNKYIEIHETIMDRFCAEGVVESQTLEFVPGADGHLTLEGCIHLVGKVLRIDVAKSLEVTSNASGEVLVQTRAYSYNVLISGVGNVFRYCSPHENDPGPVHHDHHHRHQYDPFGSDPKSNEATPRYDGDWPLLGEVIREAVDWYWENKDHIEALRVLES